MLLSWNTPDFLNWDPLVSKIFTTETNKQIQFRKARVNTFKKKSLKKREVLEVKCSMKEDTEISLVRLAEKSKKGKQGTGSKKKSIKKTQKDGTFEEDFSRCEVQPLYQSRLPISLAKYRLKKTL